MKPPLHRIHRADEFVFDRSANLRPSEADRVMRFLSRAADKGVLWWAAAAVLTAVGGRARRGGVRGLLSLALASMLANGILKPLFPRRRPTARQWASVLRGVRIPLSSSFPSGHAASAAAFTTGVALESPVTGAVLAPLAAAVAYSRVHNGVHWPSDVLVGLAFGGVVASSTRRWWAVRSEDPADLGSAADVPALPGGEGLLVVVNPGSGPGDDAPTDEIGAALPNALVRTLDMDQDFAEQLDTWIGGTQPQALGVCGGDGTVVAVAAAAVRHTLPLAVFPGGTLNHFARDAGVTDIAGTAKAVEEGRARHVDKAVVGTDVAAPAPFLNTASLGGYPDAVRLREKWQPRLGKWPAACAAMIRILSAAAPLAVTIDGEPVLIWMLFVGNGRYSPADQVPMSRPAITGGMLDVRYVRADRRASRSRLLFAAATGTLGTTPVYVRSLVPRLTVQVDGSPVALATDGEVVADARTFDFRAEPEALAVYRPQP
ncbi:phosphatase PAP2 family protein [Rhodococcus oxybenzonivorans]|uniref:Phosphatase PAP2 family protein n=2 Tax=Nocardiaceae TaxID=85025 RepID=A0AAE4UYG4_9NOCA|nr:MULTISPECIES: phosphatase PAP2 family protein [Rhodococcus]MDV7242132.1 phosphatase PAP2 family protein [Rhodococcus oxybenzonivorans]MDV7264599.1 phosphatase PAP2 family protein [Rhodococcus oxybenzonivorans]MDV7276373.1 phosphatase PAP2 family protein [Rhodococcus oxybenzonivorans]MDV7331620.1 phosphatase PAP2 family protein [Rhodococcus oxybenzonivorans]MDV7343842.1 phosphatase PAP2 family protein [Rhodococcus oxybenzonivorans]